MPDEGLGGASHEVSDEAFKAFAGPANDDKIVVIGIQAVEQGMSGVFTLKFTNFDGAGSELCRFFFNDLKLTVKDFPELLFEPFVFKDFLAVTKLEGV